MRQSLVIQLLQHMNGRSMEVVLVGLKNIITHVLFFFIIIFLSEKILLKGKIQKES